MKNTDQTVLLFGKKVFSKEKSELLRILHLKLTRTQKGKNAQKTSKKRPLVVFTPNPEQLILAKKNPDFDKFLLQADYLLPDGMGLVLASWLLAMVDKGQSLKERISGVDVVTDLLQLATEKGLTVALVGGKGYGEKLSGEELEGEKSFKSQVNWLEGYRDIAKPTTKEEENLTKQLKKLKPDIVFVAFGAPHQEKWIIEHRELLSGVGVGLVMAVGGSFDMILGKIRRAPLLLRALGLEWLFRLTQQPWRWHRQLRLLEFIWLVMMEMVR